MRVLLSTYGSRGDVEPRVGLAAALRTLGAVLRVCALTAAAPPPSPLPRYAAELVAGIGTAHDGPVPTAESLSAALRTALAPWTRTRATAVAATIRTDGTTVAAELPLDENPQSARDGRRDLESELMP